MSLSFAELARMNAMDERIKALEAEAKRRKGGRPKKVAKWEGVAVVREYETVGSTIGQNRTPGE